MCISWTSVRLGKLPMVRNTLFCWRCKDGYLPQIPRRDKHKSYHRSNESFVEGQFNVSALSLTFEYKIYFNKCSEGLDFNHFYVWSPCNFLIKDYTEIFYTIYKYNVLSIQCKKRLRWSNLMREVDCLNLVFTDFNVPTLTPGHHWVQATLEFSENVALLALPAKRARLTPTVWWVSFTYKL
jgi:hypothetical protein